MRACSFSNWTMWCLLIWTYVFGFIYIYVYTDVNHFMSRYVSRVEDGLYFTKRHTGVLLERVTSVVKNKNVLGNVDSDNNEEKEANLSLDKPDHAMLKQKNMIFKKQTTLLDIPTNFNVSSRNSKYLSGKHIILWSNPPEWVEQRQRNVPMEKCEYNNCVYTKDVSYINNSSAIVFTTWPGMPGPPPSSPEERNPNQVWVSYSLEPPTKFKSYDYKSLGWTDTFNWTMTYRLDSDVFAPYGTLKSRNVPPIRDYDTIYQQKTKMAAYIVSNCRSNNGRDEYVAALIKEGIAIDIFGDCGKRIRNLNNNQIEQLLNNYKFFIAFENSFCKDYITEKFFNRYNLNLILIVRGFAEYNRLIPTQTFINTAYFSNISSLASHVRQLADDRIRYIEFLKKKDQYQAMNEDTFGYPYSMCELCRKLNNKENNRKHYKTTKDFFEDKTCHLAEDIPSFVPKRPYNSNIYA